MRKLSITLGEYAHVQPLLAGDVPVKGYELQPVQVDPIIAAYRRMIRDLEFDICELAPVSYVMAREAGVALTAIPVFLNRRFHHGDVQCGPNSGLAVPADLEGRRVGVRAYSVSTGVWVRGVLAEEYGVDLRRITWVVDDDDHVDGRTPTNVERVGDGRSLGQLLEAGELDAALTGNAGTGRSGAPRAGWASSQPAAESPAEVYPLFAEADVLAADWYVRTGIYPLHSVIAIRQDLVDSDPELPTAIFSALAESKKQQLAADPGWSMLPRLRRQAEQIGGDPIPYGLDANAASIAALLRFSHDQGLSDHEDDVTTLFAPGDYPNS